MPDLGKYAGAILTSWAATILLVALVIAVSWWQSARVKRSSKPPRRGAREPDMKPLMILPPVVFAGLALMFYFGMNRGDDRLASTREGGPVPALTVAEFPVSPASRWKSWPMAR